VFLTEEEAKIKSCCGPPATYAATAAVAGAIAAFGKGGGVQITCRCVASDCMAWRHEMEEYTRPGGDPLATFKPKRPTGRGYCGLALFEQK
jgi:hypothetical protein